MAGWVRVVAWRDAKWDVRKEPMEPRTRERFFSDILHPVTEVGQRTAFSIRQPSPNAPRGEGLGLSGVMDLRGEMMP